jgi:hypothetical protein
MPAAQAIEIVAVLVATGDGQDAGADHVGKAAHDAAGVTSVGEHM